MMKKRRVSGFEVFLIFLGLIIFFGGFLLINKMFSSDPRLSFTLISTAFLWLICMFLLFLIDSNRSIKEELRDVLQEQIVEARFMQDISRQEITEIKRLKGKHGNKK